MSSSSLHSDKDGTTTAAADDDDLNNSSIGLLAEPNMDDGLWRPLRRSFPSMNGFRTSGTIEQDNAISYQLQLEFDSDTTDSDTDNEDDHHHDDSFTTNEASPSSNVHNNTPTIPSPHYHRSPHTDRTISSSLLPPGVLPERVFVKQVRAMDFPQKKDWKDLRRTLLYGRTEARFYSEFAPDLQTIMQQIATSSTEPRVIPPAASMSDDSDENTNAPLIQATFPQVYRAEYKFHGWIDETERATAVVDDLDFNTDESNNEDLPPPPPPVSPIMSPRPPHVSPSSSNKDQTSTIVMEFIPVDETHYQKSPLSVQECQWCLQAVAQLHAAAWHDVSLLTQAEERLGRASFHLQTRHPKEVQGLEAGWEHFLQAFAEPLQESGFNTNHARIQNLGRRIRAQAETLSQRLTPAPTDPYATIIHGDYKALNVFLPLIGDTNKSDSSLPSVFLVDFASVGIGMGVSDLAMHLHHALPPEELEHQERALVEYYHACLTQNLRHRRRQPQGGGELSSTKGEEEGKVEDAYPFELMWKHYQWAVLDYFRFFLGRFWKTATPESMQAKANNTNVNLINRSVPAAMAFVKRVDEYLTAFENESRVATEQ
jgi:hypothetical protein